MQPPAEKESDGEPSAKKAKVENVVETTMVKKKMDFVPLEKSLEADWSAEPLSKKVKRMNPALFVLHVSIAKFLRNSSRIFKVFSFSRQVLFEFQSREGRSPSSASKDKDLELLSALRSSVTAKFSLPESKIPEPALELLFAEASPVAAIVGGKLAQEIIKTISNRDAPHRNFFLFNPLDGAGVVESVGVTA